MAFVKLAKKGDFNELVLSTAAVCVRSPERFVQLGCGWVCFHKLNLCEENRK